MRPAGDLTRRKPTRGNWKQGEVKEMLRWVWKRLTCREPRVSGRSRGSQGGLLKCYRRRENQKVSAKPLLGCHLVEREEKGFSTANYSEPG